MKLSHYIILILAVLLLLSGAGNYLQIREARLNQQYRRIAEVEAANKSVRLSMETALLQEKFDKALAQHKADSILQAHQQDSLERLANNLVTLYNSSKGVPKDTTQCCKVIPIITHRADSAIRAKDAVIVDLKGQKSDNWKDFNNLLSIEQEKSLKSDSAFKAEQSRRLMLEGVEEQLEDERDKQFGLGGFGGYGATIYESKVVTGVTIGVGITYSPRWGRFSLKRKKTRHADERD
jgi:hypothetical protein